MGRASRKKREAHLADSQADRAASRAASLDKQSHRRKLARAAKHIGWLRDAERRWIDHDCVVERRQVSGFTETWVSSGAEPHSEFEEVVGEALSAMRSSLDHLSIALARTATPTLTDDEERGVSFPLDGPAPITPATARLRWLSEEAREAIIAFVPDLSAPAELQDSVLWGLNRLANLDKHRAIHVVGTAAGVFEASIGGNGRQDFLEISSGQVGQVPIRVLRMRQRDPGIVVHAPVRLLLRFDQSTPWAARRPVVELLESMYRRIENDVFPALEAHL